MAERRRQKIEDQLADAMVTLANAVRAGLSLAQSLEILAAQCPKPINAEFHQIVGRVQDGQAAGADADRGQGAAAERELRPVRRGHAGQPRERRPAERDRRADRPVGAGDCSGWSGRCMAETAQARKSAVYMAMAPALDLVVYYFIDPGNTTLLFTTPFGQMLLAAGRGAERGGLLVGAGDIESGYLSI